MSVYRSAGGKLVLLPPSVRIDDPEVHRFLCDIGSKIPVNIFWIGASQ